MTKPKFKKDDRVHYIGGVDKLEAKVLMLNSAVPERQGAPSYDIMVAGEVYTVHESYLRAIMSDAKVARLIAHEYAQAQYHIEEARKALRNAKANLELDGQPDYEVRMVEEFEIVLKNTLRFELNNEVSRWDSITIERKKG